jgi:flagellar biosynthesis protein FlhF
VGGAPADSVGVRRRRDDQITEPIPVIPAGTVRTYRGTTLGELSARIERELGPDALILDTRRIQATGPDGRTATEIEVDVAGGPGPGRQAEAPTPAAPRRPERPPALARHRNAQLAAAREAEAPSRPARRAPAADAASRPYAQGGPERLAAIIEAAREAVRAANAPSRAAAAAAAPPDPLRRLREAGVPEPWGTALRDGLRLEVDPYAAGPGERLTLARAWLADRLPVARGVGGAPPRVVALVGPPGAGATGAALSLAARHAGAGRSVAVLAAGPGGHLAARTHARALGLELVLAESAISVRDAAGRLADRDLVVVDAPGAAAHLVAAAGVEEAHLVVSLLGEPPDAEDLRARARAVGARGLVLTGADRPARRGDLVGLPGALELPLAWLVEGRAVPGGLHPATGARVAEMLLGEPR